MNWIGVELDCKLDWNWIVNWIVFEVDWELDCKLDCVYTGLGAGLQTVLCASRYLKVNDLSMIVLRVNERF